MAKKPQKSKSPPEQKRKGKRTDSERKNEKKKKRLCCLCWTQQEEEGERSLHTRTQKNSTAPQREEKKSPPCVWSYGITRIDTRMHAVHTHRHIQRLRFFSSHRKKEGRKKRRRMKDGRKSFLGDVLKDKATPKRQPALVGHRHRPLRHSKKKRKEEERKRLLKLSAKSERSSLNPRKDA